MSPSEARGMKLLIVGYGKMGRWSRSSPPEQGFEIVGRVDQGRDEWAAADVAIDFSTADALLANFPRYIERRLPVSHRHDRVERRSRPSFVPEAEQAGLGVVASANFSIGVNIFQLIVAEAARLMQSQPQYGAWIHEIHHAAKRDAPSGTALLLRDAMIGAGFNRPDRHVVGARRYDPGHPHCWIRRRLGYDRADAPARDRRGFAGGALLAARWIHGRTGWFTMPDVLRR